MSGAANTDVQYSDNPIDGRAELVDHAYGRALEYAAALRFVGLLAGIGGSDEDIASARSTVKSVAQAILNPDDLLPIEERYDRSLDRLQSANSRYGRIASDIHYGNRPATSFNIGQMASAKGEADRAAAAHAPIKAEYDELPWFYERWWNSAWSAFNEAYNSALASIRDGTWKVALGKLAIDAGFALVENAVLVGLAAFTGGAAAAALKIVRVASLAMDAASGTRRYTGKVRISVEGTRHPNAAGGRMDPSQGTSASRAFHREIEPEKEAVGDEKKVLGEENQGNTTSTDDSGDTDTRGDDNNESQGRRNKTVGDAAETKAKSDLAGQGFTEQQTVENRSGNGIDLVGRNPSTGEVRVVEVKANGASLGTLQQQGGPANTSRVLGQALNPNATPTWRDAVGPARRVQRWINNAPSVDYEVWKYTVDRDTLEVSAPKSTDWNWQNGSKPPRLRYRDGNERATPDATSPDTNSNPSTGPPEQGQ